MQVYESNLDREEMKQSSSKKNANNSLADSKPQPKMNNKLDTYNEYDYDDEENGEDSDDPVKNESDAKKEDEE